MEIPVRQQVSRRGGKVVETVDFDGEECLHSLLEYQEYYTMLVKKYANRNTSVWMDGSLLVIEERNNPTPGY